MPYLLVRARCLRVLSRPARKKSTSVRELMLILNLYGHRHAGVVRNASSRVAGIALVERATGSGCRAIMLIVERW